MSVIIFFRDEIFSVQSMCLHCFPANRCLYIVFRLADVFYVVCRLRGAFAIVLRQDFRLTNVFVLFSGYIADLFIMFSQLRYVIIISWLASVSQFFRLAAQVYVSIIFLISAIL